MKVLVVGAGEPPPTFIARLIATLRERGVTVGVLEEPVRWRRQVRSLARRGLVALLPRAIREAARSADVIHYQWPGHYEVWGSLARHYRKPALLSLRGRQVTIRPHLPDGASIVAMLRHAFEGVAGVHGVSQDILDQAAQLGLRARRSWVIRPAVDTTMFVPAPEPPPAPPLQIVMVGAIMWRKSYETAVLAVRRAIDLGAELRLVIIGEGDERPRIERAIADLRLAGIVELVGAQPPAVVRDIMRRSHVAMLSSVSEGIANSVIEGMASGLPVVATDAGGVHEAVRDGVDGFVVAPRDSEALARRLVELARDPQLRAAMGASARARAVAGFDLRAQGDQFVRCYRELASGS
jgi:glycosyltransferase involved in cell wall biosynthesis